LLRNHSLSREEQGECEERDPAKLILRHLESRYSILVEFARLEYEKPLLFLFLKLDLLAEELRIAGVFCQERNYRG
jgi:hypothetical protein